MCLYVVFIYVENIFVCIYTVCVWVYYGFLKKSHINSWNCCLYCPNYTSEGGLTGLPHVFLQVFIRLSIKVFIIYIYICVCIHV